LLYGTATTGTEQLRQRALDRGIRQLTRDTALPYETVRNWANGGDTNPLALGRLVAALDASPPTTPGVTCARSQCLRPARPRSRWCSDAHKKAAARQRAKTPTLAQEN